MARIQCRACDFDGEIAWDGELACPRCRSTNCRAAVDTAEIPESEWLRIEASMLGHPLDGDVNE